MANPSVLTEDQLEAYLVYISLPLHLRTYRFSNNHERDFHLLTQLHIHTISTLPYENLWLHYSQTHTNTIDPLACFHNIVTAHRGRGGYCFQLSILFNHVLRALGFPAYLAPVRIRMRENGVPIGDYGGWRHVVNIVALNADSTDEQSGLRYVVDVGFGGDGMTRPMRLLHNNPQTNLGSQEVKLTREWIPAQIHRTEASKLWIYQVRNQKDDEWRSFYAFGEAEATEADFEHLNYWTASHPVSFQTYRCLVVKFLRRPVVSGLYAKENLKTGTANHNHDQEVYGKRMLINGTVKENVGGRTLVVKECETEEERLEALREWFGITITKEERQGIRGWVTELKTGI